MLRWKHKDQSRYAANSSIRELVFGLEDGIVSTGGAVIGIAAGTGNDSVVVLSGFVIVIVEALSMAAGTYLSSKSKRQLLERRLRDEREEIETLPEEEIAELQEMYRERGFTTAEIEMLVHRVTQNKDLWLEEMACKELGIGLAQLSDNKNRAGVMWLAYSVGGLLPIAPFLLLPIQSAMVVTFVVSLTGLFAVGYWKGRVTKMNALRSALEMTAIAASAGVAGYVIGRLVGFLTGIEIIG
ncbi:MAG: VIT1/CCC1 transporter family protein [Patescibacteria group bacterium]